MQALLLNGSPRGAASNTLRLSRAFLQGTGWPFETFSLTENRIEPCRGCMACWRSGAPCTIADDFSAFVGQFRRADVLIASFPLYYFGLPAQLKALLDRTISLMEPYHGQTPEGGHCSFQTLRDPALRRKKLVNSLMTAFGSQLTKEQVTQAVTSCGLEANIRGERLGLSEFAALSAEIAALL